MARLHAGNTRARRHPALHGFRLAGVGLVSFGVGDQVAFYYAALVFLVLSMAFLIWLASGRTGLALKAIRDAEEAANSLGVDPTRYKLIAFVASSFVAGVAGAYYAHYLHILTPDSAIGVSIMVTILVITLVGGIGTIIGPLVGSFVVTFGLEALRGLGDYGSWSMACYWYSSLPSRHADWRSSGLPARHRGDAQG